MKDEAKFVQSLIEEGAGQPDFLLNLHFEGPNIKKVDLAHIADDLCPEAEKRVRPNSRLLIVGNDGISLCRDGYRWPQDLLTWVKMGCEIEYFLSNPRAEAMESLNRISSEARSSNAKGRLDVFQIDPDASLSKEEQIFVNQLTSFHFVIFENPEQLWVELNHQPGEVTANDCFYFPPEAASDSPLYGMLKSRFEHLIKNHCIAVG